MGKKWTINNLKRVCDLIFWENLANSAVRVDISYMMSKDRFLFETRYKNDCIYIKMNVYPMRKLLEGQILSQQFLFNYYVSFVAEYVHFFELEKDTVPKDYINGLAAINAQDSKATGKKHWVYASVVNFMLDCTRKFYRPIDYLCEVNAILKTKAKVGQQVSDDEKKWIDKILDYIIEYVDFPECVQLPKVGAMLTVRYVLKEIKIIESISDEILVNYLIEQYNDKNNQFALGLLMRLISITHMYYELILEHDLVNAICNCACEYQKKLVQLFMKKPNKKDYTAELQILKEINKFLEDFGWNDMTSTIHIVV